MKKPRGHTKPRPIPEVLTEHEQDQLLEAMAPSTPTQLRNLVMVRLMLNAGLRSCEVVALRQRDIEWTSGKLKVQGKGGRQRILWLPDDDLKLLSDHVAQNVAQINSPDALIFQTRLGNPIDTRFLRAMVETIGRRAGLKARLHPHLLRHTFATDLLRQTKNIVLVQKALGHANIGTTMIYTHIVDDELEEAMKARRNGG